MSFLKTVPEELTAAAAQLGTIGAAMAAQNAAAAAPTTAIAPAALDEVSALQAALFTAYGTFYQQVSAEAQAMHDMFVNTLGISAGTYGVTESLNSSVPPRHSRGSQGKRRPSSKRRRGCSRPNSRVALPTSSTSGPGTGPPPRLR